MCCTYFYEFVLTAGFERKLEIMVHISKREFCQSVQWTGPSFTANQHTRFTFSQRTPVFSTCHRRNNASALASVAPQNIVLLDMVAERRKASSRVEPAEGSQDSAAAASATDREQAWSPQQQQLRQEMANMTQQLRSGLNETAATC